MVRHLTQLILQLVVSASHEKPIRLAGSMRMMHSPATDTKIWPVQRYVKFV